jgi:hypothetical protein
MLLLGASISHNRPLFVLCRRLIFTNKVRSTQLYRGLLQSKSVVLGEVKGVVHGARSLDVQKMRVPWNLAPRALMMTALLYMTNR